MDDDALDGESELMTAEDVAFLNREAMRDLAVRGRFFGIAVIIVSVIGALAWLWVTIRTQQHLQARGTFSIGGTSGIGDPSLADRIDAIAGDTGALILSALTFGLGIALSMISSHLTITHGGTLSGLAEGDEAPLYEDGR